MANTCECDSCVSDRDHITSAAPPRTYRAMPAEYNEAAYAAQHAAERAQDSLLRRFEALAALVPADIAEHHGVKSLLEGVKEEVENQSLATDYMIHYIPREFRRPDEAAPLARKVFGTPELLEKILLFAPTRTVFDSMRVSKDFFNTIEGSLKLQKKAGLMPDAEAHISFKAKVFVNPSSGLRWEMKAPPHVQTDEGPEVAVEMTALVCEGKVAQPGPRLRSVQLMQPPIKDLDVSVSCCDRGTYLYRGYGSGSPSGGKSVMHSKTGLTVGAMRDKVVEMQAAHRMCPHASIDLHDSEGFVVPDITFRGKLLLQEDDYSVVNDRNSMAESRRHRDSMEKFEGRMDGYMRAKEAADDNYLPIPTLAEYEAEKERRAVLKKGGSN